MKLERLFDRDPAPKARVSPSTPKRVAVRRPSQFSPCRSSAARLSRRDSSWDSRPRLTRAVAPQLNHEMFSTGNRFDALGIHPRRDVFGWIEIFVNEDLSVEMRDNAIATEGCGGIVIGRNLTVPEPDFCQATLSVFLMVCVLQIRRRRGRAWTGAM